VLGNTDISSLVLNILRLRQIGKICWGGGGAAESTTLIIITGEGVKIFRCSEDFQAVSASLSEKGRLVAR
jgi:hypothetical protein